MGLSRVFLVSASAAVLLFSFFPELDIRFSMCFYDPASRFYLADAPFCKWIYQSVEIITIVWVAMAVLLLAVMWIRKKKTLRTVDQTDHLSAGGAGDRPRPDCQYCFKRQLGPRAAL